MSANTWRKLGIATAAHVAFVAVWWISVVLGDVPEFILPTPWQALQTLGEDNYNWMVHFSATAQEVFGGYILAVVVGVAFAAGFPVVDVDRIVLPNGHIKGHPEFGVVEEE